MTDNRNRTVSDVRHAFAKCGGNLGTEGSVAYLFEKKGIISFEKGADEDRIMEIAVDAGADDIVSRDDGGTEVVTQPEVYQKLKDAILASGLKPAHAELSMVASTIAEVAMDNAHNMLRLIEMLEDLDDVQNVYSNAEFPDDLFTQMGR
jgi:YebC/PmpR family DNA-binding regulatory protein